MDIEKIKKLLKDSRMKSTQGHVNCIRIGIDFLKNPSDVSKLIKNNSLGEYCSEIIDLWQPAPTTKQKVQKKCVKKILHKLLKLVSENYNSIKTASSKPSIKYEDFQDLFSDWLDTCNKAKKKNKNALKYSNPFVTVSVQDNYDEGKEFQLNAKFASSIEGSWGTWIEKVFYRFNPKIKVIGAGRLDFALNSLCFDVKSGPRVYNAGQIDESKAKRDRIRKLSKHKKFGKFIKIKDFQIAGRYGRETLADAMKGQGSLILFGKDTWKKLTGDEWNSFRFFVWQIRFSANSKSSVWKKKHLEPAINEFVDSFYEGDPKILTKIKKDPDYKKLLKEF